MVPAKCIDTFDVLYLPAYLIKRVGCVTHYVI
jgi:hypothetical protein